MEQKLVLHEAIHEPKLGDIIIEITDVQFHTNARVTTSQANTIDRSVQSNKPGRVFSPMSKGSLKIIENNTLLFSGPFFDYEQLKILVTKYNQQGKRVFIKKPTAKIPLLPGKDTVEFVNSIKGQRILRRLEKQEKTV